MPLPLHRGVLLFALACPAVHGCTQLDDGAVEVSWSLYTDDGDPVGACGDLGIDEIALYWDVEGVEQTRVQFPCGNYHGVTRFVIPEGTAALWLVPRCDTGADADVRTYDAPAPIVRTITAGDVVTLDTQLIQLKVSGACDATDPCICSP